MKKTSIEKFSQANLRNLSNNLYSYLKETTGKRINISKDFDFDDYKEFVRYDLIQFSIIYLINHNSKSARDIANKKALLKNYVDEILDNEEVLDNFTVYKIQQFINRVAKNMLKNHYETFVEESKKEKYIEYKDIELDATNIIGFVSADKVINYLYKEFNLKRLKQNDYSEALVLKATDAVKNDSNYVDEINKLLFKAAVDVDEKNHVVISHPVKDDDTIIRYLEEGYVADKTPKRVIKKVLTDVDEEDILKI